jgi:hypothetical protein
VGTTAAIPNTIVERDGSAATQLAGVYGLQFLTYPGGGQIGEDGVGGLTFNHSVAGIDSAGNFNGTSVSVSSISASGGNFTLDSIGDMEIFCSFVGAICFNFDNTTGNANVRGDFSAASISTPGNVSASGGTGIFGGVQVVGLTPSQAVVTDGSSNLASSSTTSTELGYIHGLTGPIMTVLSGYATTASPNFSGIVTAPVLSSNNVNINASQSTVGCSTSGSIVFSMPFQGPTYKKVMIYLNACQGSASYTYPTAFSHQPNTVVYGGLGTSYFNTVSTSAVGMNVAGAAQTGILSLEGF